MELLGSAAVINMVLNWRAVADILLISAGIFFLYRTLRGLGTWKIVTGILVAVVFYFFADVMDLKGIEWIFGNLSQVAVIALIVIFQPELRKILEKAASVRRAKAVEHGETLAGIIAEASFTMAQKHQGALVVFPGKEPVEEWLSGGYPLGAKPSGPLILSLFDPNSPGHDGALIVSSGVFDRFGVRLPLSLGSRMSQELGTRHHAAMGLSEKSDALVVVVSEERGQVSVFRDGQMHPVTSRDQLVDMIISHGKEKASYLIELPGGSPRWMTLSQMGASLALAALFYSTLIIAQGQILEKFVTVPVKYTASPPNLALIGERDKEFRLHLAGQRSDIDAIIPEQLSVTIDLSKAVAGKQNIFITRENIRLPRHVDLLNVTPPSIEISLAEIIEQEVPIKPQLVGKLPSGLRIRSITVKPDKVKVLTPALQQQSRSAGVITTPIYLESISNDIEIYCKVIAPPAFQPVEKRWPDVEVTITVGR